MLDHIARSANMQDLYKLQNLQKVILYHGYALYMCVNHQHWNLDCTDDDDGSYFILLGLWSQTAVKLQQQGRGGASCNSWSTHIHKSCKPHSMLQIICSTGKLHKCNTLIQIRSSEVFDSVISASCCNGWLFLNRIVFLMSGTNATFNKWPF